MEHKEIKPGLLERRTFAIEVRAAEGKARQVTGHAAVFNITTDIGGWFKERVLPGAFKESIGQDDIRALFNHDPNIVLGRNKAGTLRLSEDEVGLAIEIDLPDTQAARDLAISMERGDVTQMSFGFEVLDASWDTIDGEDVRVLKRVKLWDVSPVTYPAYEDTDASVRSLLAGAGLDLPAITRAIVRSQHGSLTGDDRALIKSSIERLTAMTEDRQGPDVPTQGRLDALRMRAEHAKKDR